MFLRKINDSLDLALVQPSFATDYLNIITEESRDLASFLPWVDLANNEDFFYCYIKKALHEYAEGTSFICAIIYKGKVIGNIGLNEIDHNLEKANLGYWISKKYRRRGIVTTCTNEIIKIAFNEFGLNKIEIKTAVENIASRAIPEKLGFTLEGIITQAERLNGRVINHALYALHEKHFSYKLDSH